MEAHRGRPFDMLCADNGYTFTAAMQGHAKIPWSEPEKLFTPMMGELWPDLFAAWLTDVGEASLAVKIRTLRAKMPSSARDRRDGYQERVDTVAGLLKPWWKEFRSYVDDGLRRWATARTPESQLEIVRRNTTDSSRGDQTIGLRVYVDRQRKLVAENIAFAELVGELVEGMAGLEFWKQPVNG